MLRPEQVEQMRKEGKLPMKPIPSQRAKTKVKRLKELIAQERENIKHYEKLSSIFNDCCLNSKRTLQSYNSILKEVKL